VLEEELSNLDMSAERMVEFLILGDSGKQRRRSTVKCAVMVDEEFERTFPRDFMTITIDCSCRTVSCYAATTFSKVFRMMTVVIAQ